MDAYQLSENYLCEFLNRQNHPYIFLETLTHDKENKNSFFFNNFTDLLIFNYGDDPGLFFKKAQDYLDKGYWLCGYFAYEFGYFLEPALKPLREKNDNSLAWLGACKNPVLIDYQKKYSSLENKNSSLFSSAQAHYKIKNIRPNISHSEYSDGISQIKHYLEEGLTYQVNFTFKVKFDFEGELLDFYLNLRHTQPTSYAALINTGQSQIISFSPELFFRIRGKNIVARPMKGTIARGKTPEQDRRACVMLRESEKIRAENVMIVDLLRNDLGRISKKVRVAKLFEVEKYRTLYQMTSTIEAKLKDNLKLKDIFSSLFPCGSVTGAPKIKTMEIIKSLEKEPRGIYTGAIGYIAPNKKACFNVAIRTIQLRSKAGELGIGGGIVYDSLPDAEYNEALLKAKFFMQRFSKISLVESILWEKKEYFLLDLHLKRLQNSCDYFSIPLDLKKLKCKMKREAPKEEGKFKVRLMVDMEAKLSIEKIPLDEIPQSPKVKLSSKRIDPRDILLYHKTTQRELYDQERAKANSEGFFEVIFLNKEGQLTEGSITNIFIEKNNQLYTPPLQCGLLPGVFRQYLLKQGKAKEKTLYLNDICKADTVYIGNSLRGLVRAEVSLVDLQNESKIGVYAKSNSY